MWYMLIRHIITGRFKNRVKLNSSSKLNIGLSLVSFLVLSTGYGKLVCRYSNNDELEPTTNLHRNKKFRGKSFEDIFDSQVSVPENTKERLHQLAIGLYNATAEKLYSSEYWGKYGSFSGVGMEVQGSLAYGMMLPGLSDLDIAFVYSYENGSTMEKLDLFELKNEAMEVFKNVFGNKYNYEMKSAAINLSNNTEDIDIAFYNLLKESTPVCSTDRRCAEINYGESFDSSEVYLSERLSSYSELDKVFSKNTDKRKIIDRAGKMFKIWKKRVLSGQDIQIPSIALVIMIYDFCKEVGSSYTYKKSTDTLRDVVGYGIVKYFKNAQCDGAADAEIDYPVYQKYQNLIGKLNSSQRMNFCTKLVEFHEVLIAATSERVNEDESVKLLEPFIGPLGSDADKKHKRLLNSSRLSI